MLRVMTANRPVPARAGTLITVAPTGAESDKASVPALPVTLDELTATAVECRAAGAAVILVHIRDGEAQPTGGMGLARQFKYEIDDCPPVVVLIARPQDAWLASWSLADAVINTPIDPIEAAAVVAEQIRRSDTAIPVVR